MPIRALPAATDAMRPRAVLVVSQRPRPGLGRILPTLEALGVPAVAMLAGQIGDALPPPFHSAPQQVAVLAIDTESVRAGWRAGAALVAGLGSGSHAAALSAAGAELVLQAPSEISSGSLLRAYADKFQHLPLAAEHLAALAGTALALFFDFDGTLAPIPDHPTDGRLPSPVRELLSRLAARHPLAVVSGRALADLGARVALPCAYLAGNHGLELRGPDYAPESLALAAGWQPLLDAAYDRLAPQLAEHPGCVVEHKGVTLSVHYRGLAATATVSLRRDVVRAVAAFDGLVVDAGRQVLEIRPAIDWDKGAAVDWLLARMRGQVGPCTPVYFGDDVADEAGFRAVRRAGGQGVLIAPVGRPTAAGSRLDSPEALQTALLSLLA